MAGFLGQRRTVVFALALVAFIAGLVTGRDLLFTLAYLLGLLLILSFVWVFTMNANGWRYG